MKKSASLWGGDMLTTEEVKAHASDPELAAALAESNDEAAAARLSHLITDIVPVPINRLAAWGASKGLRARLQDAADDKTNPLRSIALTALDLLQGGMSDTFDTVVYADMLDALQAGGLFNTDQRNALTMIASQPRSITANDVALAVRNDDGSSKL